MKSILQNIGALLIGAIVAGSLVWFFAPGRQQVTSTQNATHDDQAVKIAIAEQQKIASAEKASLIARILHLEEQVKAKSGSASSPVISPLQSTQVTFAELKARATASEARAQAEKNAREKLDKDWLGRFNLLKQNTDSTLGIYNYDFIIGGWVHDDEIQFLTLNPYQEIMGNNYVKTYLFDRRSRNFEWATIANPTPSKLDGINLNRKTKFLGVQFFLGGGFQFPVACYALFEPRMIFYEVVEVAPRIRAILNEPIEVAAELRLKL